MNKFIAVAGNIGVGKSTLVKMLCAEMGWEPFYEPVAENPYLADFYHNMSAWAFHSQVFFLTHRLQAHFSLAQISGSVVQDRSVYEDAEIFAENLYRQGNMTARDYKTYRELYETTAQFLPPPDLVIYLRASVPTLIKRINSRGRDYERKITPEYLQNLNELYETWIDNFTLCPALAIPADDLDYVAHSGHLKLIVSKVEKKLSGKEEVLFEAEEVARAAED
ncbi:MAG: deoxynucleoside kinase [Anaerolineales bacterium]